MNVIAPANEGCLAILKRFRKTQFQGRLSKYCVAQQVEEGVLLFNLMTREMVLLTEEEYGRVTELDYLRERWFVVPEQLDERECMEFVRLILKAQSKDTGEITGYTIFTTTDCNARCFYCFELGRSRIPMSEEIAKKTADYIKAHCGGKKVKLAWFGGEPLMNPAVIDLICRDLHERGIEFESKMTTNGYLFDDVLAERAVTAWELKRVQITLDGTEEVYNRIKAFVYPDTNPYQIVLDNIQRLLERSVTVIIRLNMDLHNARDLLALAEELAVRFRGQKGLCVYAHHLFKEGQANAGLHTDEEWAERNEWMDRLNEVIASNGMEPKGGIAQKVKLNHCMADSGRAVTILPDGNIGLCEHYTESEFIGHLDRDGLDSKVAAGWKERTDEVAECADCFFFPECFMLKKCTSERICYPALRHEKLQQTKRRMLNSYRMWQVSGVQEGPEDDTDFTEGL